jgi:hypothetical protein
VRRSLALSALVAVVLCGVPSGCESPASRAELPEAEAPQFPPPQIPLPKQKRPLRTICTYGGTVAAVDPDGLELAVGWEKANKTWARRAVQQLIPNELGIVMPVRTVGLYLQRWGYTAKRPRRHARKQDPEEIRRWLATHRDRIERFYLPTMRRS